MPIYFFNIRSENDTISDAVGHEFLDIHEARENAIRDGKQVIRGLFDLNESAEWTSFIIEICDQSGDIVDTVELTENVLGTRS